MVNPQAHGVLDLITVAVFALAPTVVGLEGGAATLSYVLAVVHLAMSLVTAELPISMARIVPLPAHGMVEAAVAVVLGVLGLLAFDGTDQTFYLVMAVVIAAVFVISQYTSAH